MRSLHSKNSDRIAFTDTTGLTDSLCSLSQSLFHVQSPFGVLTLTLYSLCICARIFVAHFPSIYRKHTLEYTYTLLQITHDGSFLAVLTVFRVVFSLLCVCFLIPSLSPGSFYYFIFFSPLFLMHQ